MEPFKVYILGCGSALPTLHHNASSQIVELREKMFMIDCGEGTQIQLRRSRIRFTRIGHVFITHLHGDHCFGLIGMISTFGMLGRTAPLHIHAPAELEPILHMEMAAFCQGLEYEIVFHAVDPSVFQTVYEDRSLTVTSIPLDHRVPCCGYLFREKAVLPHIRRDMIDYYRIPLSQISNIKNGADWVDAEGNLIPNSRLTMPAEQPRSYAYCSDTRYMPELYRFVAGVTVLYHESTYDSSCQDRARLYYHSTARQAAQVASDAHVGKLVLGHFSARYDNEKVMLDEAVTLFPDTILGHEGLVIDVK